MALSFKILKLLYFVIFRAVQIFANFRPGGPGGGAPQGECAIGARTGSLRRRLRGISTRL